MHLDTLSTLKELVAIPSVSPMGRELTGPIFGEARLTEYLEKTLLGMGLAVHRQTVAPGRENVIARLDGDKSPTAAGGCIVLLDAHQDTVPVDGMTIEPFRPQERDGRLYGRGACDTKGGMAAMLAAVARLAQERPRSMPTIVVSCTADEENGFRGAARLPELWTDGCNDFVPRRPDAALVLEPTMLNPVVAHRGVIRWRVHANGRAAHSAHPEAGDNAIYRMAKVVTALEEYAATLSTRDTAHPLCGPATVSVGTIHGGAGVNTVPDRCTIEIDYRPLPGEELVAARRRMLDQVMREASSESWLENESPYLQGMALSDEHNGVVAEQLTAAIRSVVGGCRRQGASYCTNAPFYAAAGIPTVVFGPGCPEQAHTADEWLPVNQLFQAEEILYQFCRSFAVGPCG